MDVALIELLILILLLVGTVWLNLVVGRPGIFFVGWWNKGQLLGDKVHCNLRRMLYKEPDWFEWYHWPEEEEEESELESEEEGEEESEEEWDEEEEWVEEEEWGEESEDESIE